MNPASSLRNRDRALTCSPRSSRSASWWKRRWHSFRRASDCYCGLRYQQDLTLEEVARLARIPDPYRAHREIRAALEALGDVMTRRGPQ